MAGRSAIKQAQQIRFNLYYLCCMKIPAFGGDFLCGNFLDKSCVENNPAGRIGKRQRNFDLRLCQDPERFLTLRYGMIHSIFRKYYAGAA
jgi:hypothetical protein